MKYLLTNEQMRKADFYTIETLGVPSLTLMERAGVALADKAERLANGKVLCVCGGGNNGGDGFVCARILQARGVDVDVLFFAEKTSRDCDYNRKRWAEVGGKTYEKFPEKEYGVIIDCLFGTGFHGDLDGENLAVVEEINGRKARGAKVLSADIPSGVGGGNGRVENGAVKADVTLCIGEYKLGAFLQDGLDYAGEIKRVDIGISLPETDENDYAVLVDSAWVKNALPKRKRNSHKGTYGRAAIVAGSLEYTGAAYLSASACLRAGAGYTTLGLPQGILPYYLLQAPEILLKSTNDGGRYAFTPEKMSELLDYDSIAYGMGMGISQDVAKGAEYLLQNYAGKLLLDADGLNSLAQYFKDDLKSLLRKKKCEVVLTPHAKEFSRLSGKTVGEITSSGLQAAVEFAKESDTTVLLKGAASILTDGRHTAVIAAGNSGLAKGGSGDVLSGVIAALCASGASVFDGAGCGAYLLGKAAELGGTEKSEYSLTATDVIAYMGKAFLSI